MSDKGSRDHLFSYLAYLRAIKKVSEVVCV